MRVFEVGLRSLDALQFFEHCENVILVDALHDTDYPPGTLRILAQAEIPPDSGANIHEFGVNYLLQALAATHPNPPPVALVGAVADTIIPFTNTLSACVASAVDIVVSAIMGRILSANERGQS